MRTTHRHPQSAPQHHRPRWPRHRHGWSAGLFVGMAVAMWAGTSIIGCGGRSLIQPEPNRIAASAADNRVAPPVVSGAEAPARRPADRTTPSPTVEVAPHPEGNPAAEAEAEADDGSGSGSDDAATVPGNPGPGAGPGPDADVGTTAASEQQPAVLSREQAALEALRNGRVPEIPLPSQPREVRIDEDRIYAVVNGEVITYKDILDSVAAYRLALYNAQRETLSMPWRQPLTSLLDASERAEIRQSFERAAVALIYRQEAKRLRSLLGSIPREQVDLAIEEAIKRHGIDTADEATARREMQRRLAMMGMTWLDFERQVREQIEANRVAQYYMFVPLERLGTSLDFSPAELQQEYLARPIQRTENVQLLRVRFPLLVETNEERNVQVQRSRQFVDEVRNRFDDILRNITSPEAREQARQRAFAELAAAYLDEGAAVEPELLPTVNEEPPEVAEEIRRTSPGALSDRVVMIHEIQVLYVIDKSQSGREPFSSPAVQRELEMRLRNRRWNDFRHRVDRLLLDRASIHIREAGAEFNLE